MLPHTPSTTYLPTSEGANAPLIAGWLFFTGSPAGGSPAEGADARLIAERLFFS